MNNHFTIVFPIRIKHMIRSLELLTNNEWVLKEIIIFWGDLAYHFNIYILW